MHSDPSVEAQAPTPAEIARNKQVVRRLTIWANVAAVPVAVLGFTLSFHALSVWALPMVGPGWNLIVPVVVDAVIFSASLQFIAGAKAGKPMPGWRWMAHAGIAATLIFNAEAALPNWGHVLGMAWPPLVWSVYVELYARQFLGEWREQHVARRRLDKISLRLWLTAPIESARVWLRMERRLEGEQADARLEVGLYQASLAALDESLPGLRGRKVRGIIRRQLRAGSLEPHDILIPLGWHTQAETLTDQSPRQILRAVLSQALLRTGGVDPAAAYRSIPSLTAEGPSSTTAVNVPEPAVVTAAAVHTSQVADPPLVPVMPEQEVVAKPTPERTRPVPVTPAVIDLREARAGAVSTGNREQDAAGIYTQYQAATGTEITGVELATKMQEIGWSVSERTAQRILASVREALRQQSQPAVLELAARRSHQ